DERQRFDQARPPSFGAIAQEPTQMAVGLPALRFGFGIDEIGQTLDCRQIKTTVFKGAAREFPRLGKSKSLQLPKRAQYRRDHRPAPMQLQLGDVFPGLAARRREPQRQSLIDGIASVWIFDPD